MAILQALWELADASLIIVLALDLAIFAYLVFRLGRDREWPSGVRGDFIPEPQTVRVNSTEVWRKKR